MQTQITVYWGGEAPRQIANAVLDLLSSREKEKQMKTVVTSHLI